MNSATDNSAISGVANKWRARIAILSIALLLMGTTAVSPAMAKFAAAFPNVPYSTVSLVVGIPSILLIPFSILAGIFAERWNNKRILIIGLVVYVISGISGVFTQDLTALLISRAFFGAGLGIISPFSTGLIANFFDGEQRARMMGFQSAANSLGSILLNFTVGFLAAKDWHNAFWVYALGFAVLALVLLFLPNSPVKKEKDGKHEWPNKLVYLASLKMFLFMTVYIVYATHLSVVVVEKNFGNTVSSGLTLTVGTLGGLCSGIFFSRICRYLGKYAAATALACVGIGFIVFGFAQNLGMMIIGALFAGAGFSVTCCYAGYQISLFSPKSAMMTSMGILLAAVNVGQFVSPFFADVIGRIFRNDSGSLVFKCSGALMLAAFVISLIFSGRRAALERIG